MDQKMDLNGEFARLPVGTTMGISSMDICCFFGVVVCRVKVSPHEASGARYLIFLTSFLSLHSWAPWISDWRCSGKKACECGECGEVECAKCQKVWSFFHHSHKNHRMSMTGQLPVSRAFKPSYPSVQLCLK